MPGAPRPSRAWTMWATAMLDALLEFVREWSPALSTLGIAGLALTLVAFLRSEGFRRYMGGEHRQNLVNFKVILDGCLGTIRLILLDTRDEDRYARSTMALLMTMSDALSRYEIYVDRKFRSAVPSLRLVLLCLSTAEHAESVKALRAAGEQIEDLIGNLGVPPGRSHPA